MFGKIFVQTLELVFQQHVICVEKQALQSRVYTRTSSVYQYNNFKRVKYTNSILKL